jgi:hypothetical protein
VTPTPTDADVERVAWAIMVASKAFADSWIDPVAIARAAIAAMPAPGFDAAAVRALREREAAPTPTDADVERVARVLCTHDDWTPWSDATEDERASWRAAARAAIAAMPAPSSLHVTDSTAAAIAASNDGPSPFPATGGEKAGTIPEGWRLVPVEPTTEMLCVGSVKMFAYMRDRPTADSTNAGQVWKAMLAAAPPAPASEDK